MGAESRANAALKQAINDQIADRLAKAIPPERHKLIDRYGRPILVLGTYSLLTQELPVTVEDITPIMHPGAPPDSYLVRLSATIELRGQSRAPMRPLILLAGPPQPASNTGSGTTDTPTNPNPDAPPDPPPTLESGIVLTDL